MNDIVDIYKAGLRVLVRAVVFYLLVAIPSYPALWLIRRLFNWQSQHPARAYLPMISWLLFLFAVAPFIYYGVSRLTGEFVLPRARRSNDPAPNNPSDRTDDSRKATGIVR